jgi:site-specific DNA-methyltransferase (adenine-specific)
MAVHFSSATPEWYTPRHIVDKVLELFGHIDLDPCSNAHGDAANVPARFHFTRADDGLAQSWAVPGWVDDHGEESVSVRVYMNPPYGDEISAWVDRLVEAYLDNEITEAVALLPARVDTAWFAKLDLHPICYVRGRLRFVGGEHSAPFPSAIVYLGPDLDGFLETFGALGGIRPAVLRCP